MQVTAPEHAHGAGQRARSDAFSPSAERKHSFAPWGQPSLDSGLERTR